MSTFTGSPIVFDSLYQWAPAGQTQGMPLAFDGWLISGVTRGASTDTQPITDEIKTAFNGQYTQGVNRFFLYDRIQIDPSVLDLGNLVSAQTQQVSIWNGYFTAKTVTSFTGVGTDGIDVTEPFATPYSLSPFQQVFYQFNISLDGPAVVNATYTAVIDGSNYTIEVTGSRVVLWPFPPNWNTGINESLEWVTDVLESFSGNEQRISLRTIPRRRLDYQFMATRDEAKRLDNILWGWQNRAFAVPLWQYKCRITSAVSAGAVSIPVVTAGNGFIAGQTAILMRDSDYYEVIEILTVNSNSIVPKRPLELDWAVNSCIYPVAIANFEANVPLTRMTDTVVVGKAAFIADPEQTDPYVPVASATDVYNGYEIILKQPEWSGGIDNTSEYPVDTVDFDIGRFQRSVTRDTPTLSKRYVWHFRSRAEVELFRGFLGRRKGRNRACYIPSWHDDYQLTQDVTPVATTIFVKDVQGFTLVGADPARAHIMIRSTSGQYYLRPIQSIGKTGNEMSINIGTALGVTLTTAQCKTIHLVMLYRLSSDRVSLLWKTDGIAVVDAMFQSVKA